MIDLNNINKTPLTKEEVFKHVNDWEVYQYYSNVPLPINKSVSSPLRSDTSPSFRLFIPDGSKEIFFKDFNLSGGDCVKFVQMMHDLDYYEALSKIIIDFGVQGNYLLKRNERTDYNLTKIEDTAKYRSRETTIKELNTYKLGKSKRNWELRDMIFWKKFGITKGTLERYFVEPVSHLFLGEKILYCKHKAYCFIERKDKEETYKIYQPEEDKYKWLNNHNFSVWQGWTQLPKTGEFLIITKSLKDVMAISDVCNIPAVALQTENSKPKEQVIEELRSRFKHIFVFYDNDFDKEVNWGRAYGKDLADSFNFEQIEIPDSYTAKDFSDFVVLYGEVMSREFLTNLIKRPF